MGQVRILMDQKLIILRGVPSSGKSTIAKKMRNFEKKVVWLKVDSFKDFFADDSSSALEFVNGTALASLRYLLENGFSVVMEGVFQDTKYISKAVDIAKVNNIQSRVFELETSLATLKERDKVRAGVPEGLRPPLGDEVIERLFNILKNNPFEGAIKIDTQKHNIDECIDLILQSFSREG